jgi:hypothetical protein
MKRLGWFLLPGMAMALILGETALAQNIHDNSVYFVTYYSNAQINDSIPDQTVRMVNDGDTGANLWASFYVFDDSQEMQECCSCEVTPDGLTSESVLTNFVDHSLTGKLKSQGIIKVISSSVAAAGPANFTNKPTPGVRIWTTHTQGQSPNVGPYYTTETPAAEANLASSEKNLMETLCYYVYLLGGGGQGICTCTPEDSDF